MPRKITILAMDRDVDETRVDRGGCWSDGTLRLQLAWRLGDPYDLISGVVGLRLVASHGNTDRRVNEVESDRVRSSTMPRTTSWW